MRNYFWKGFFIFFISLSCLDINSQTHYWIFFSDKDGVEFNPYTYFDTATIRKRLKKGIELNQYSDFPLRSDYISKVEKITGNKSISQSRWLNAMTIEATPIHIDQIRQELFVTDIIEIRSESNTMDKDIDSLFRGDKHDLLDLQLKSLGIKYFEQHKVNGKGVRIAVFDAGFPDVDKSSVFEHLIKEKRIIATYDFVKKDSFVYDYHTHGTKVLACIAGKFGKHQFGLATGAEFLLARTEIKRETFSEEENWLCAVEWADKNGADIISSSLGFTFRRYFQQQMDGKYTLVSRAANIAASKGILVINAAGNDGLNYWEVICAPADADSILTVGAVSPKTGYHEVYSSLGPTYDGRMKPNVCAFGHVVTSDGKKIKTAYGTSLATPLISGFAACVLQMNPDWDNMRILNEIQKSSHLYPYFDYAHGYGVPQASYFTGEEKISRPSFSFAMQNDSLKIFLVEGSGKIKEITRNKKDGFYKKNCCNNFYDLDKDYLYYKITADSDKKIRRYGVINMKGYDSFNMSKINFNKNETITVYYKGFVDNKKF